MAVALKTFYTISVTGWTVRGGEESLHVEIKIDAACTEPKIVVLTDRITDEVSDIVKRLSEDTPQILSGFRDDTLEILEQNDVYRFYASLDHHEAKGLMRELEDRLDKNRFVRISNSEIVNIQKVRRFDLSLTGTICISLSNGTVTYVSRRYVRKIKQVLGI